jgi:lysozyme
VDSAIQVQTLPQQKAALVSIVYKVGAGRAASRTDPGRNGVVVLASAAPSTLPKLLINGSYGRD